MDKKIQEVKINRLPIELCQFLKFQNIVQSGGEVKMLIVEGFVLVNGVIEMRKGKKLQLNDMIEIKDMDVKFVIK